jgi:hypothetical protein
MRRTMDVRTLVDIDDVFEELDTDTLVKELKQRADHGDADARRPLRLIGESVASDIGLAIDCLLEQRYDQALRILEDINAGTSNDVVRAYEAAKRGKHPFLWVGGHA